MNIEKQCNGVHQGVDLICSFCHAPKCQSQLDGTCCMSDLFHEDPHENPYSDLSWDDPDYTPKTLTDEEIAAELEHQAEMQRLRDEARESYQQEVTRQYYSE